ncbi:MAG: hypothetical protein HY741_18465, partial [Chloroflexi bacterium]|nr:hypothetical protein [Chloroflexota bacterium]
MKLALLSRLPSYVALFVALLLLVTFSPPLRAQQVSQPGPAAPQPAAATRRAKSSKTALPQATRTHAPGRATRKLAPGIYHLTGSIQRTKGKRITLRTTRGVMAWRVTAKSRLAAGRKKIALAALARGATVDALVRVNAKHQIQILRLSVNPNATPGCKNSSPPNANHAPRANTAITDLAAGLRWSGTPAITADAAGNLTAVWYSDGPPAGLWLSTRVANSSAWTAPQYLDVTNDAAWLPALAADDAGDVHLVWEA